MATTRNRNTTRAPASTEAPAPAKGNPAFDDDWQDVDGGSCAVRSFQYMEEFHFQVTGKSYDEYMPRIARNDAGLVPVLPCKDLETDEDCLLILPGFLNSWLRRNQPAVGTRLAVRRKGKDPETGAWKLAIKRL